MKFDYEIIINSSRLSAYNSENLCNGDLACAMYWRRSSGHVDVLSKVDEALLF